VLTINLLQALPKTPLWDRLEKAGRLDHDPSLESNVRFVMPYDEVVAAWKRCIAHAYTPERLFARFVHQMEATYAHRVKVPVRTQLTLANLRRAAVLGFNIALRVGILSDYRRVFWRAAREAVRRGQIEAVFNMGFVAHHMIRFTQEALAGQQNASFYAVRAEAAARPEKRQGLLGALNRRAA
jgi:FMN phosphatase YigB (HAD superfamily)